MLKDNTNLKGKFLKDSLDDWNMCVYEYGNPSIVSCNGLGKMKSYPMTIDEITDIVDSESLLNKNYPKNKLTLWKSSYDILYVIYPTETRNIFSVYRIDLVDNKVLFTDFDNISYTYQLNGMTLIGCSNIKMHRGHSSIRKTVTELIEQSNLEELLKDEDVEDFVKDSKQEFEHDIVLDADVKKLKRIVY